MGANMVYVTLGSTVSTFSSEHLWTDHCNIGICIGVGIFPMDNNPLAIRKYGSVLFNWAAVGTKKDDPLYSVRQEQLKAFIDAVVDITRKSKAAWPKWGDRDWSHMDHVSIKALSSAREPMSANDLAELKEEVPETWEWEVKEAFIDAVPELGWRVLEIDTGLPNFEGVCSTGAMSITPAVPLDPLGDSVIRWGKTKIRNRTRH